MIAYLDTSVALRVLVTGPSAESVELTQRVRSYLDQLVGDGHRIVSSALLRTEMLCQANRQPEIERDEVLRMLSMVNLVELTAADLNGAPNVPGRLRTLDAIHMAVALRVGADLLVAYDDELLRAARTLGLNTGPARR